MANIHDLIGDIFDNIVTSQSEAENFTCLRAIIALKNYVKNIETEFNNTFEKKENKSQDIETDSESDIKYPSVKAVYDYIQEIITNLEEYVDDEISNVVSTLKTIEYITLEYTGSQVNGIIEEEKLPILKDNNGNYYYLNKIYLDENDVITYDFYTLKSQAEITIYTINENDISGEWTSSTINVVRGNAEVSTKDISASSTNSTVSTSKKIYDYVNEQFSVLDTKIDSLNFVEYIDTTYTADQITALLINNKFPILVVDDFFYPLSKQSIITGDVIEYSFSNISWTSLNNRKSVKYIINDALNTWSSASTWLARGDCVITYQMPSTPTNTTYLSSLAVYNYINDRNPMIIESNGIYVSSPSGIILNNDRNIDNVIDKLNQGIYPLLKYTETSTSLETTVSYLRCCRLKYNNNKTQISMYFIGAYNSGGEKIMIIKLDFNAVNNIINASSYSGEAYQMNLIIL